MILRSPSPGTSSPLNSTVMRCQAGSSLIFLRTKYLRCSDTVIMNALPDVNAFESKLIDSCTCSG